MAGRARIVKDSDREVILQKTPGKLYIEQSYGNLKDTQVALTHSQARAMARWILKVVK